MTIVASAQTRMKRRIENFILNQAISPTWISPGSTAMR
jgi:hypothetical protein